MRITRETMCIIHLGSWDDDHNMMGKVSVQC